MQPSKPAEPHKPRGGKRPGAGRPRKTPMGSSPRKARRALVDGAPVHVVLRIAQEVGSLRQRGMAQAIRRATDLANQRDGFQIMQLKIQPAQIDLIVEARDKVALAVGMQGFQISAAKHINRAMRQGRPGPRRRGTVFPDRYFVMPDPLP